MSDQPNEDSATPEVEEAEPLNRAERRAAAKGKGRSKGQPQGKAWDQSAAGHGSKGNSGAGPRLWANRRAG